MSQKHLPQLCVIFQKYVTKMTSCDFRRVITIPDKLDVGAVRNTQEMKRFLGTMHRHQSSQSVMSISGLIST